MLAELVLPQINHAPEWEELDHSRGVEACEVAETLGLTLDEHQKFVLMRACARRGGKWAYSRVGLCEPRQNGKGVILEIREVCGLFIWDEPLQIHSAHEFATSQEHFARLEGLIDESDFERQIKRISRGHGEEGIHLKNGCRLRFRTRTKGGTRGFSGDSLYLDEAMILPEMAFGAMRPILRAREDPQMWLTGSAVDQHVHEHGVVFSRLRERALKGEDKTICYFEWTLIDDAGELYETPDAVPMAVLRDEESWRTSNPAYGIRIDKDKFEQEIDDLSNRTFAVEILGVGDWPRTDGFTGNRIKPQEWELLAEESSSLQDPIVLAYDISPERRCSIAAAGRNAEGRWHLELIANYPGTKQLLARLEELSEAHKPFNIVCDGYGPAASLMPALLEAGLVVNKLNSAEHAAACGLMADAVAQRTVRHLGSQQVTNAVRGAATRPLGDAWAWSRKNSSVDISPLVAMTLALYAAQDLPFDPDDGIFVY